MKWRYVLGGGLVVAATIAGLFNVGVLRSQSLPVGAIDPAIEYLTKGHRNDYAAIDRWAHYGMRRERFVALLQTAGYECRPPTAISLEGPAAIQQTRCEKTERWPFRRTLSIHASFKHGIVPRLIAVKASSSLASDGLPFKPAADLLRKFGWMEPADLTITGFKIDSIETLSRMIADTLSPTGWYARCTDGELDLQCKQMAEERMTSGFPGLPPASLPAMTALELQRAMERIRFLPVQQRNADGMPEDSLLTRIKDGRIWLNFVSRDLSGNDLAASIELASPGGTPINLLVALNGATQSIKLAGSPRRANDGSVVYLLPKAGPQDWRHALWLHLPNMAYPGTIDQFARNLPLLDVAFVTPMAKTIIDGSAAQPSPEESIQLYPKLQQIEQKAEAIRRSQLDRWLPPEQGNRLIAHTYPQNPIVRAAWAFATCEPAGKPGSTDDNCLSRFMIADPDAAALVRSEVAHQQWLYRDLPDSHPLRIRLVSLQQAFAPEPPKLSHP